MKKLLIVTAAILLLGAGCGTAQAPPPKASSGTNAYPGTEPYTAPTTPPPGNPQ